MRAPAARFAPSQGRFNEPNPPCCGNCEATPLRRLRVLAEGRRRKRQWSITTLAATSHRYRSNVRRGNPGHRHKRQSHPEKMPGLQDAVPGDPQRARQRRTNPLLIKSLRLAPESTLPDYPHHYPNLPRVEGWDIDVKNHTGPTMNTAFNCTTRRIAGVNAKLRDDRKPRRRDSAWRGMPQSNQGQLHIATAPVTTL